MHFKHFLMVLMAGTLCFSGAPALDGIRPKNVLGKDLVPCSFDPLTGWSRDGSCRSMSDDACPHTICCEMSALYLKYSQAVGNDLTTPYGRFTGLLPGDRWCLCVERWKEAYDVGVAPKVVLESTHRTALDVVTLDQLQEMAAD